MSPDTNKAARLLPERGMQVEDGLWAKIRTSPSIPWRLTGCEDRRIHYTENGCIRVRHHLGFLWQDVTRASIFRNSI